MPNNNPTLMHAKAEKWFSSDHHFDQLYPPEIQDLAKKHWTPLYVARKAALFLTGGDNNDPRILDIGSGVGKFCLAAAQFKPKALYYGVEQRTSLVYKAETARQVLRLENVSFIPGNFTTLDFREYDHFYCYNPFYENLVGTDKIDNSIIYSSELYNYYNRYLYNELDKKPIGTRLATYHSLEDEVPKSYAQVGSEMDQLLKFWIKS
jgi:SAM-dependent methyltransferase